MSKISETIVGFISKLIDDINYWWTKHSGQYHWFEVRFVYSNKGNRILDWVGQVGVRRLKNVRNKRVLKKDCLVPLHKDKRVNKYLCNGNLDIEIICYLGKFKK